MFLPCLPPGHLMPFAVLWECDYCPDQFPSRKECYEHEDQCVARLAVDEKVVWVDREPHRVPVVQR